MHYEINVGGLEGAGTLADGTMSAGMNASALAVKSEAAKRGLLLEKHGGLWVFVNLLAKESGDKDTVGFFGEANALHRNFYEGEMERETVEINAETNFQISSSIVSKGEK